MGAGLQGCGVSCSADITKHTLGVIHMAYWHLLTEKGVFDNLPYGDTSFTKSYDVNKELDETKKIEKAFANLKKRMEKQ